MLSRRKFLTLSAQAGLVASTAPVISAILQSSSPSAKSVRCLNVVNFIRGVEPREVMDLILPVQKQIDVCLEHGLPVTWLLQFDAMVTGPFVEILKRRMAPNHEVGFWYEMNELLVRQAKVEWRGRPGFEWDSHPSVAFSIGYTKEERIKLVDTAMAQFKLIWGRYPSSVASWNLDSISMSHLSEQYRVDAFAVCRDQIATDGFTIWGAPIAGYYPSKLNCWSPALEKRNQISTPVFRMLGQDPVYYYYRNFPLPDGRTIGEPDTMEPVWTAGRSPVFVKDFLEMITDNPCLEFAYAQLGQENSFGWPTMTPAYEMQMKALAKIRDLGSAHVETLGETGRRFKKTYSATPTQAQILLKDPFENKNPPESTVWYQSRFYRANLHIRGDQAFLRDLTVYSDHHEQPHLNIPTRAHDVDQHLPAVIDGYHWSKEPGKLGEPQAGGFFEAAGRRIRLTGAPVVIEKGHVLMADLPLADGILRLRFEERDLIVELVSKGEKPLSISFQWDSSRSALPSVETNRVEYQNIGLTYLVHIKEGRASRTNSGWTVSQGKHKIQLTLAQNG